MSAIGGKPIAQTNRTCARGPACVKHGDRKFCTAPDPAAGIQAGRPFPTGTLQEVARASQLRIVPRTGNRSTSNSFGRDL